MNIPTNQQCLALLEKNKTPPNVIAHCRAVHNFAVSLSNNLQKKGVEINIPLVESAALLHDIEKIKPSHVIAGHDFVLAEGYPEVAAVMKKHGLEKLDDRSYCPKTTEEKVVFYADKRIQHIQVVPLEQRFAYIRKKYNSPAIDREIAFTKAIENEFALVLGAMP